MKVYILILLPVLAALGLLVAHGQVQASQRASGRIDVQPSVPAARATTAKAPEKRGAHKAYYLVKCKVRKGNSKRKKWITKEFYACAKSPWQARKMANTECELKYKGQGYNMCFCGLGILKRERC